MDGVEPAERDDAGADPPLTPKPSPTCRQVCSTTTPLPGCARESAPNPDAQQTMDALNRVRRDIAALGADTSSAPDVAPAAVDRIGAALRAEQPANRSGPAPARRSYRPPGSLPRSARVAVAAAGLAAVAAAVWLGTAALITAPGIDAEQADHHRTHHRLAPAGRRFRCRINRSSPCSTRSRTSARSPTRNVAHHAWRAWAIRQRPGARRPPGRDQPDARPSCWCCPATRPTRVAALAVAPTCSSADTGLLADRIVHRP